MDTMIRKCMASLNGTIKARMIAHYRFHSNGWDFDGRIIEGRQGQKSRVFHATRKDPYIRVWGEGYFIYKLQCQLPEILHGYNGMQIKSAVEHVEAEQKLTEYLASLLLNPPVMGKYTRFDFAYNLPCNPWEILQVAKLLSHPQIRKDRSVYKDNNVQLIGKDFTLSFYQKANRRNNKAGKPHNRGLDLDRHCLRVEVQAKTPHAVRNLYGSEESITFEHAWKCYRGFMLKLGKATVPVDMYTPKRMIALATSQNLCLPNGTSALDWSLQGKAPETVRKARTEISKMTLGLKEVVWEKLFPELPPKTFIDIHPDDCEVEVVV